MGFGPFSSESQTKDNTETSDNRTAASEGSIASGGRTGKGSKSVTGGGIVAGNKAQIGGLQFGKVGRGATVNITTEVANPDSGALENVSGLLSTLVNGQANAFGRTASDEMAAQAQTPVPGVSKNAALIAAALVALIVAAVFLRK